MSRHSTASTTGGYDTEAKHFRIIIFSSNGPFTEDGNCYEGKVAGGKLTDRVRHDSITTWVMRAGSGPTPTAPSQWLGGCGTRPASGGPG
jgi:hypothetical protein